MCVSSFSLLKCLTVRCSGDAFSEARVTLQHTATHCNILQPTATHCIFRVTCSFSFSLFKCLTVRCSGEAFLEAHVALQRTLTHPSSIPKYAGAIRPETAKSTAFHARLDTLASWIQRIAMRFQSLTSVTSSLSQPRPSTVFVLGLKVKKGL